MFGIAEMNPAMPELLPFLLRLAGDPELPERSTLLDHLIMAADHSEPVDPTDEVMALWFGVDSEHPERERCRAVFMRHASVVEMLPNGLIAPDSRAKLRRAAGLL
ncbi:hypothetical protein [Streptomyces sp. NPDC092370]|uniref:hypothetical protein n=1 Tax=Streptomyces sp. NPDC092370 TaxID=3366016 RepID=UPI0037F501D1